MRRTVEDAAATREAILESALVLFAQDGVRQAPLAAIAEHAGVTRGALYHHFHDREQLHAEVLAHAWSQYTAHPWDELEKGATPRASLRAFLTAWLDLMRNDPRFEALLTILFQDTPSADAGRSRREKADAVQEWIDRLAAWLRRHGQPRVRARHHASTIVAWLCGTAIIAATDPTLLPAATSTGVAPLVDGVFS